MRVSVKVYAAFHPVGPSVLETVRAAGCDALSDQQEPWIAREKDLLTLSFDGVYFPVDEVLEALAAMLDSKAQGKLDYIDMDAWSLTRHTWTGTGFKTSTRSLNHVLDYSGH